LTSVPGLFHLLAPLDSIPSINIISGEKIVKVIEWGVEFRNKYKLPIS
jgi:hypothetical protein